MVGINVPIPFACSTASEAGRTPSSGTTTSTARWDPVLTKAKMIISRWPDLIHRGVDLAFLFPNRRVPFGAPQDRRAHRATAVAQGSRSDPRP